MKDEKRTKEQMMSELADLRQHIAELETAEAERNKAEERSEHLNLVLRAIRNVNQLITREEDRDKLLKRTCKSLIETRGYYRAWIVLLDDSGKYITGAHAGLGKSFTSFVKTMKPGEMPICVKKALKRLEVVIVKDTPSTCGDCPLVEKCAGRSSMAIRLEYEGRIYGVLGVSCPSDLATDEEERFLFTEVAGDIAFALHNMELKDERRRTAEALRESEKRYRFLLESITDGVQVQDREFRYLMVNDEVAQMVQMPKEKLIGNKMTDLFPGIEDTVFFKTYKEVLETGEPGVASGEFVFEDGRRTWFEVHAYPAPEGILIIVNDITERKQAEEELTKHHEHLAELVEARTSELLKTQERLNGIFDASKDAIGFFDLDGMLIDVNNSFSTLLGYSRKELLAGKKYQELTPEEYHDWETNLVGNVLKTGEPTEYEKEYIRKDGSRVPIQLSVFIAKGDEDEPIGVAAFIRDITERKDMQERLMRQEKLALLGQLAGGVGHELRNPLGAIKNATYFLNMAVEEPEPEIRETLEILDKEVATSERIISSLLGFARPKPPALLKVDVNDTVQVAMSRAAVPENVEIVSKPGEALPVVLADPDQLGPVFDNLILNAIQAMPKGGKLTITSDNPDPEWVTVSVTDTGVGIPEENLDNLFEPLFTTKAKGIGLGLPVAKTLVEGHGGTIEAESKAGKGSTFTVSLPVSGGEEK